MSSPASTAVGLLGGTFDPIHIGHLRGALECREKLGLDQVALVPASLPPLKSAPGTSAEHRARMAELAVAGLPWLTVDRRELERPGQSYTVDTLRSFRETLGEAISLTFILGVDSLVSLHRWQEWQHLLELANLAVLVRPGIHGDVRPEVAALLERHAGEPESIASAPRGVCVWLQQNPLQVSSTGIRETLRAGKSVRFLLPDPVIEYISDHDLYSS